MRGFDSVVIVEGPRGGRCRERCGQSSAATTSASVSATPSGPRPRRGAARQVGPAGLARQHQDPAQPDALGGRDIRARIVADHREAEGRQSLAEVRAQRSRGLPEDLGRWLAEDPGRPTGGELEPGDEPAGVEGLALVGQPPRIAMHRQELGATADQPERDVQVPVRQVVARVADHHRADGSGGRAVQPRRRPRDAGRRTRAGRHRRPGRTARSRPGGRRCRRPSPRSP